MITEQLYDKLIVSLSRPHSNRFSLRHHEMSIDLKPSTLRLHFFNEKILVRETIDFFYNKYRSLIQQLFNLNKTKNTLILQELFVQLKLEYFLKEPNIGFIQHTLKDVELEVEIQSFVQFLESNRLAFEKEILLSCNCYKSSIIKTTDSRIDYWARSNPPLSLKNEVTLILNEIEK